MLHFFFPHRQNHPGKHNSWRCCACGSDSCDGKKKTRILLWSGSVWETPLAKHAPASDTQTLPTMLECLYFLVLSEISNSKTLWDFLFLITFQFWFVYISDQILSAAFDPNSESSVSLAHEIVLSATLHATNFLPALPPRASAFCAQLW